MSLARAGIATAETALAEARARAEAECTSGRGRRCRAAEQQAEADYPTRGLRSKSGAGASRRRDGGGSAGQDAGHAASVPLSERTIELYAPAVLPLSMLVVGFALLLYGVPHRAPPEPKTATEKSARKRPRRKATRPRPPSTEPLASNVVPFRAANENWHVQPAGVIRAGLFVVECGSQQRERHPMSDKPRFPRDAVLDTVQITAASLIAIEERVARREALSHVWVGAAAAMSTKTTNSASAPRSWPLVGQQARPGGAEAGDQEVGARDRWRRPRFRST